MRLHLPESTLWHKKGSAPTLPVLIAAPPAVRRPKLGTIGNSASSGPEGPKGRFGIQRLPLQMVRAAGAETPAAEEEEEEEAMLKVHIDNQSDSENTVLTVEGKDQPHLLMTLSGALTTAGYMVVSADITSDNGLVLDVFRLRTEDNQKVPESSFRDLKTLILSLTRTSNRSGMPAIYGVVAAAEVDRLAPLSAMGGGAQDEVSSLELSAALMAQAAADLVAREREILDLSQPEKGTSVREMSVKERGRKEAAAVLERRMSAMEALLVSRRSVSMEPSRQKRAGISEKMKQEEGVFSACGTGRELLLQAFNWESCHTNFYQQLIEKAPQIQADGFTAVWCPPPSNAVSDQGYLPGDYYDLNSKYGTEEELRKVISVFHDLGIKVIADIVINHRCAQFQSEDGRWNKYGGKMNWDETAICCGNDQFGGRGNPKQGDDYGAAPNIDHSQEFVRRDIIEWLNFLRHDVGFDGWRFDFVRGWPGHFAKQYIEATNPAFALGEYWDCCEYTDGVLKYSQDNHRQQTVDWCDNTGGMSSAFDFTTKGILQEAVGRCEYWRLADSEGRPPGVIGLWPSRAVTFLDNHDTGSTLNHWPYPWKNLPEGYAYLLTHCGTPCVFVDHLLTEKGGLRQAILQLMALRQKHGINARSKVHIHKAAGDFYAAVIDDKIVVKIGPGDFTPRRVGIKLNGGKEPKLACSGHQFAVWEANEEAQA
ncbi:glycoside hydrolase superfamily [Dunaliella salina]|uniref:Alpha-amylase n=1 Tax=Dunaliella salina TaxID=3046 RepID=A0ABQ7H080_DUNSA|nr:glycoside hydrolase superfamily [Dunaliella salina]|eukprot:KAF5840255.1 glycoside hydrolase superfamily [Dunaliella salina]